MSNLEEVFLIKDSKEVVEFKILATTRLIFEDESCHDDVPGLHKREEEEEEEEKKKKDDERCCEVKTPDEECERPSLQLGEVVKVVEEDDDGFKTPTSLDHKLPVIKQCPPAPKKPKPPLKRRFPANKVRRNLPLEFSEEVESLFPFPLLSDSHRNKKSRREII